MLGLKTKDGRPLFTEKEMNDQISQLNKKSRLKELKAIGHENFARQLLSEIDLKRNRESN